MRKNLIFVLAVILLFTGTAVTFARNTATTGATISAGGIGDEAASIKTLADVDSDIKLKYSQGSGIPYVNVAPSWNPVVGEAGAVTGGDLYYLDTSNFREDVLVRIYLINTDKLSKDYSYLNLRMNVWTGGSNQWQEASKPDGSKLDTTYLTLTDADASFILKGDCQYCITIDDGNYFCIDTDAAGGSLSPEYYIDAQPL